MGKAFKKMKYPILTLAIFLSISTSQAIESKEEFKASVIRTLNDKDWSGYLALTFKEGMNDYDFKRNTGNNAELELFMSSIDGVHNEQ